jgi:hypothetical protein
VALFDNLVNWMNHEGEGMTGTWDSPPASGLFSEFAATYAAYIPQTAMNSANH